MRVLLDLMRALTDDVYNAQSELAEFVEDSGDYAELDVDQRQAIDRLVADFDRLERVIDQIERVERIKASK